MFEREIQRAKELLMQRVAAASQFVYWQEVRERADVPVFYRNFFGAEVQWWIFEEQLQRAANPRFDYAHQELAMHTVEADRFRMDAARFDHQDLTSTIDLAVKTRFNYILRPRTTLKWFVYRGEPTKTLSEVLLRMDYFLEYDYLLDGFRRWISTKQNELALKQSEAQQKQPQRPLSLVSVVEFDRTLQSVDNDVILDYSPEEFTDLLTPIFEMFDEIHAGDRALQQYRGKVPMPAIIIFLDDKGIYRIAQELEEVMKTRSLRYIGQREFLHLLNDIVNKLEQETPLTPAENVDTITLPLAFDTEPIINPDDTIGELALGAAKRKPKPPSTLNAETLNAETLNDEMPTSEALNKEIKIESNKSNISLEAKPILDLPHGNNEQSSEGNTVTTIPQAPEMKDSSGSAAEAELPQNFSSELSNLAAILNTFDVPTQNPVQASIQAPSEGEIHDAEFELMQTEATQAAHQQTSEASSNLASEAIRAEKETEKSPPPSNQSSNEGKSGLFSRWSSIFSNRADE